MMNSQKLHYKEWAESIDFLINLVQDGKEQEIIDAANMLKVWKKHNDPKYDFTPGEEDELRDQVKDKFQEEAEQIGYVDHIVDGTEPNNIEDGVPVYGDDDNVERDYLAERGL